uniref:Uncharacterized protein n=1 Tax=Anopheles epiroticus TaxID=199890 RepID=A0A182P2U5_9DIPT
MAQQKQSAPLQLALLDNNLFTCVLTAGTNVKKYVRQTEKSKEQLDIIRVSKFVFDIVQRRTMPLDVSAKIVCGMGQIFLFNVQKLRRYKEDRKQGKDGRTKQPLNLEDFMMIDIDHDDGDVTEKEVIDSLLASQKSTTVQNVDDITLRELPSRCDVVVEYESGENDFGEAQSNELLNFFNDSNAEDRGNGLIYGLTSEPPVTQELIDFDSTLNAELQILDSNL